MIVNWGDVPAWIAAVGTVGTLIAVLAQIELERRAKQRLEVQHQAERIATWVGPKQYPYTEIMIQNQSNTPIYNVVVTLVMQTGAGPRTGEEVTKLYSDSSCNDQRKIFLVIPPGLYSTEILTKWGGMGRRPGAEIAFTDARGGHWVRRLDGQLESLNDDALTTMEITIPFVEGPLKKAKDILNS